MEINMKYKYSRKEMVKEYEGAYGADTSFEIKFLSDLLATKQPKVVKCECYCHKYGTKLNPCALCGCSRPYLCCESKYCSQKFSTLKKLNEHKKTHQLKKCEHGVMIDDVFECKACRHIKSNPQLKDIEQIHCFTDDGWICKDVVARDKIYELTERVNLLSKLLNKQ